MKSAECQGCWDKRWAGDEDAFESIQTALRRRSLKTKFCNCHRAETEGFGTCQSRCLGSQGSKCTHCGSRSETVHSSSKWQPDPFPVCYKSTHQENSCNFSSLPQKYQLTYLCPVCTQKKAVLSPFPQAQRLGSSVWEELYFLHFWGISKYLRTQQELLACRLCGKIKRNLLCISQDIFTSK